MKKRAQSEEDKKAKYQMILDITAKLFAQDRKLHTSASIAKEAKIAKGTLYLYFKTKEEIYMELMVTSFSRWHTNLRNHILDVKPNSDDFITYLCRSLADYTTFIDLVCLTSAILEEHLDESYVRQSRQRLRKETNRSADLIALTYPQWQSTSFERLRRFYTYANAYWRDCFPASKVADAMPQEFGDKVKLREAYFEEILYMSRLIWSA